MYCSFFLLKLSNFTIIIRLYINFILTDSNIFYKLLNFRITEHGQVALF